MHALTGSMLLKVYTMVSIVTAYRQRFVANRCSSLAPRIRNARVGAGAHIISRFMVAMHKERARRVEFVTDAPEAENVICWEPYLSARHRHHSS